MISSAHPSTSTQHVIFFKIAIVSHHVEVVFDAQFQFNDTEDLKVIATKD